MMMLPVKLRDGKVIRKAFLSSVKRLSYHCHYPIISSSHSSHQSEEPEGRAGGEDRGSGVEEELEDHGSRVEEEGEDCGREGRA